jgi:hypothetical protein
MNRLGGRPADALLAQWSEAGPLEAQVAVLEQLGFELVFENDCYLLLQLDGRELAFMQPGLDFQQPKFRRRRHDA